MKLVLLLALASINLVHGKNIINEDFELPSPEVTSIIARSSAAELNCTAPFTAIGSSCLHFVPELAIDHEEADFVCESIGGHLAVIDSASQLQDVVQYINPKSTSPIEPILTILDSSGPPYNDNSGPDKVIDGDISSYWNVDIPNARYHNNWFITFELERRFTVVSARIRSEGDRTHDVREFKLESSDDLVNWHLGGIRNDVTVGSSEWQTFNGFKATGKYLRFTITETQSGWQPYLSEVSFTGYADDGESQSYWIDGVQGSDNHWSFVNSPNELPMGTPFWSTNENSGNCLTLSSFNSYYFTETECQSKLPSPLCEQGDTHAHDGFRGTIESPNFPHNYPNYANNEWTITTEENATITVTFETFNTESGYDYLTISDGLTAAAPDLLRLAGSHDHSSISPVTSTGNAIHVKFTSDGSVTRTGFKLNWVVTSTGSEIIDVTCPPFYTAVGQDCYAFVFIPMTFNKAKITCASMNGQLGVVGNAEQLRSLYLYINEQEVADVSYWIGGSDQGEEGHFTYVDGSDVPQGTPFWGTSVVNSGSQEPDGGEDENCVGLMPSHYFLADVPCNLEFNFLCSPL